MATTLLHWVGRVCSLQLFQEETRPYPMELLLAYRGMSEGTCKECYYPSSVKSYVC